jgi:DNA polymerase III psi subunit
MRNLTVTALAITVLMIGTGCSSKHDVVTPDAECMIEGSVAPSWVCGGNTLEGYYVAVGAAPLSKLGQSFSRREAMANARSNLAQQIQTEIKDKVETFARATGVGGSEVADKVSTQVSKQVARVTLGGSKQLKYWEAPSKEIYLLVGVPADQVNKEVQQQVQSSYRNDDALWQQFQSKNALEGLEKEFPTH